jgi:hypothetical protein
MRHLSCAIIAAALLAANEGSAAEPDGGLAVLAGGASNLAGFIVGGAMLAANHANALNNAGWLTIEGGFTLAPFAAHAAEGEWGRGALFASVPAACLAGSAAQFGVVPTVIDQGSLPEQRVMWGLFVGGQVAAVVGVIDAAFAPLRARKMFVAPTIGAGHVGLTLGGIL